MLIYNIHNQTTDYFDTKDQDDNINKEEKNNQLLINAEENESENINLTFGDDDLEVPAFLRKNN